MITYEPIKGKDGPIPVFRADATDLSFLGALVGEVPGTLEPWLEDNLAQSVLTPAEAPLEVRGSNAIRLRRILTEAATGTLFTPDLHRIPVDSALRDRARATIGLVATDEIDVIGSAEPATAEPSINIEFDTSPSKVDQVIRLVFGRALHPLTGHQSDEPAYTARHRKAA